MADPTTTTKPRSTTATPRRTKAAKATPDAVPDDAAPTVIAVTPAMISASATVPAVLTLERASIGRAQAVQVDVRQGAIGRLDAADVAVHQGAVGMARADKVSVEFGMTGLAIAGEARVSQGFVRNALTRDLRVEQGAVGLAVANHATFERTSGVFMLIARDVRGSVRPVLDWRGALAFGAAFALVLRVLRRR
jgi:hypothetical protein